MINRSTIDKIMQAASIEEVVGDFVQLKRAGANFRGLSPFTAEKTPSFYVVPSKGIFKDFSSGKGGNAVAFLMEHEKISYPEALRWLAKRYNIEIEEDRNYDKEAEDAAKSLRESLFVVNEYAAKSFHEYLQTDAGSTIGLAYFKERNFTPKTIETFSLGFAPENRTEFTEKALKDGYKKEFLVQLGLTVERDNGSFYDRFAGRVMFPIHNLSGRVIAFGGRVLKKDEKTAKYLNSPESELYHKSSVLYGLFQAKSSIVKSDVCYLVEGYTDVISLHQAGFTQAVASAGTSLTEEQARLIRRFTKNVTVLYDGDAAGIRASMRGIDILLQQGLDVRVLLLPDGEDPDSLAKKDPNRLEHCLKEEVKDFISFKTDVLLVDAGQDPLKKAEVLKELARTIALIDDPMRRSVLHMETAKQMGADERIFLSEINKNRLEKAVPNREERDMIPSPTEAFPAPAVPIVGVGDQKFPHELYLLRLLVHFPDALIEEYTLAQRAVMEMEGYEFEDTQAAALFTHIASEVLAERPVTQEGLVQIPDPSLSSLVVDLLTQEWNISENWAKSFEIEIETPEQNLAKDFESVMDRIKLKTILGWIKEIDEELKAIDHNNENALQEKLIAKKMFLEQIQEITKKYGTSIYR